jgi:hypothetical protein
MLDFILRRLLPADCRKQALDYDGPLLSCEEDVFENFLERDFGPIDPLDV